METTMVNTNMTSLRADEQVLHCARCFKNRVHSRRVSGGMEVYTCRVCGKVQSYVLAEGLGPVDEEVEA